MLEPCRVFLLRHGLTDWNAERRLQGHLDHPLNAIGHRQARQLGQALADEDIAAIYSSDLLRARQTAAPLAQALALPVHTDPMLRERHFGHLEGLSYQEIDERFPEDARGWRLREPGFAPGGGETLSHFYDRTVAAVARLAAPHAGESIALFSHGGLLDCLHRAATGLDLQAPRSWQLRNASINRLLYTGSGFVLVGWDDHAHLEADAAPAAPAQLP